MLNKYPKWVHVLIVVVLSLGCLFSLPNLFGDHPAIQISASRGAVIDEALLVRVTERLGGSQISMLDNPAPQLGGGRVLVRFENEEDQIEAQTVLKEELGNQYVVALNLAPATPAWLRNLGALPMYLGLDLRGGIHFLMEVDMDAAVAQAEERNFNDVRALLREEKLRYKGATRNPDTGIRIRFKDDETRQQALALIREDFEDLILIEADPGETFDVRARLSEDAARETREAALQQNITTLRSRVNELGVAEPVIQQQGSNRVVVQLPGIQDSALAKRILGATATLEFRMVHPTGDVQAALAGQVQPGAKLYRTREGTPVLLERSVMLTGDFITNANSGIDQQNGSPAVFITLDGQGAKIFAKRTGDKIGLPMATIFIEHKSERVTRNGETLRSKTVIEEVINIATIRSQLGKRFQITGLDSTEEARNLALLLRAGALAAPIEFIEERTVGPTLGQDNIDQGKHSVQIAFVLVLLFMAWWYRVFGLVANLALAFNLVLIVAVLSMFQATLTLPGIAGIVLTVGMAVDANVLIFERIREELRNGNTPQASIHAGYEKAFWTIFDANITTFIAAVVLFGFGTGPIKGFAITLAIGIVSSMFTAIVGTRAVINLIYGGRRVATLSI